MSGGRAGDVVGAAGSGGATGTATDAAPDASGATDATTDAALDAPIAAAIRRLLGARAPSSSICPSEVARSLAADEARWRALMPAVRVVAAALAGRGEIEITRGGLRRPPDAPGRGPVRLRRGPAFDAGG